jgi:preprotein translocase subunit YajC
MKKTIPTKKEVDVLLQCIVLMAPAAQGGKTQGNPLLSLLPLLAILLVMYFLLILPQSKRQKQHKAMMDNLQKGDKVLTAGGIVGTIVGFKEKENLIIVKIDDNVNVDMTRNAVAQVIKDTP